MDSRTRSSTRSRRSLASSPDERKIR